MNDFVAEPFENNLGQTFHPGDEVIYFGYSHDSTTFRMGFYRGVTYGEVRYPEYLMDEDGNYIYGEIGYGSYKKKFRKFEMKSKRAPISVAVDRVLPTTYKYRRSFLPKKRIYKPETSLQFLIDYCI